MINFKKYVFVGFVICSVVNLSSCRKEIFVPDEEIIGSGLDDWTEATHSNSVSPNYDVVFDQSKVNRIDIVITADEYQTMQEDLAAIVGSTSSGGPGGGGPGGGGGQTFSEEPPVYVPADFYFNGQQWYEVGIRYKGNSSLYSTYNQGIGKFPLRFKFDYFEDDYPEINNQRFYGFKDISMSSNYNDKSFMREKGAAETFRAFGVPAPRTAFFEVYMDYGEGSEYLGLYTMVEVVFDSMLEDFFGSESGNCYKPDGDGAKFGASDFSLDDFEKKTNENDGDWSDIQAMYDALHASTRTTDVEAWKTQLESLFDVDGFLKYLAANNAIQNWDTYGNMTHNFFLYHDPADDLIKWIVWDNNEAFQSGGASNALSFEMDEVSDEWPLISYLVAVPEYRTIYDDYLREFIDGEFQTSSMDVRISGYDALISNSATSEISGNTFLSSSADYTSAVSTLRANISSQNSAANSYLN
jgi:spore coat protein H